MDMINVLIFLALVVVFAAGWWCGKRWGTVQAMLTEIKASLRSSLDEKK
jgi:lipopolysaccharide biosynthesis regulator YciM